MDTAKQVRAALGYAGMSVNATAKAAGYTTQNLNQRLHRDSLRPADLEKIANAIGAEYISVFRFPDGKEI